MPLLIFFCLFIIANWIFYQILVVIPLDLLAWLSKAMWFLALAILISFLAWCFGDQ
jgi:hypothetical protein